MSDTMSDILEALKAPFPPERVSWRVGSTNKEKYKAQPDTTKRRGKPLCYIDARDVMDRLDEVTGGRWQNDSIPMHNQTVCCRIGLEIEGVWLWRCDGAGATDFEGAKGAYSDALKRSAVLWGIGRYLYGIDSPWIELDEWWGIPKDAYPRLNALLTGEKQQSAYAARKDGDYPRVETLLRLAAVKGAAELAKAWKAQQKTINAWPDGWVSAITEEKDRLKAELAKVAA